MLCCHYYADLFTFLFNVKCVNAMGPIWCEIAEAQQQIVAAQTILTEEV